MSCDRSCCGPNFDSCLDICKQKYPEDHAAEVKCSGDCGARAWHCRHGPCPSCPRLATQNSMIQAQRLRQLARSSAVISAVQGLRQSGNVANTRFGSYRNLTTPISCQAACYNLDGGAHVRDRCMRECEKFPCFLYGEGYYAQGESCVRLCAGAKPNVIDKCFDDCLHCD
jgi:hypothetical protein